MGTRGAYGFRYKNEDYVTYNHFDSYPEGLGRQIVKFVKATNIEQMKQIVEQLILVDENEMPSPEIIKEVKLIEQHYGPIIDLGVSRQTENDWYCLLRETQGDLFVYKFGLKYMIDAHRFLYDSVFCEYAYIINLNTEMLEVYTGFNLDPNANGRYAHKTLDNKSKYYGVKLMGEIPIETIQNKSTDEIIGYMNEVLYDE